MLTLATKLIHNQLKSCLKFNTKLLLTNKLFSIRGCLRRGRWSELPTRWMSLPRIFLKNEIWSWCIRKWKTTKWPNWLKKSHRRSDNQTYYNWHNKQKWNPQDNYSQCSFSQKIIRKPNIEKTTKLFSRPIQTNPWCESKDPAAAARVVFRWIQNPI